VIAVVVDVVVERSEGTADWRAWVTAATSRYSAWSNVPAENSDYSSTPRFGGIR